MLNSDYSNSGARVNCSLRFGMPRRAHVPGERCRQGNRSERQAPSALQQLVRAVAVLLAIQLQKGQDFSRRLHEVLTQRRDIELPVLADHQLLAAEFPLELRDACQGVVVALGGAACDAAEV